MSGQRYANQLPTPEAQPSNQIVPTAGDVANRRPIVPSRKMSRTQFGAFKLTGIGLEIGDAPQQTDWKELGEFLFSLEGSIQWLIGDWLACGEHHEWGETEVWADYFGREVTTLYNITSVCRKIEFSRRRENVPFSHHQDVAGLSIERQNEALDYAAGKQPKRAEFRKWLKGETSPTPLLPDTAYLYKDPIHRKRFNRVWKLAQKDVNAITNADLKSLEDWIAMIRNLKK